MIYKIPKQQIQKWSNKGDMIKKPRYDIEFSEAHNSHKTYPFLLEF
jgi:hypothetical protein